MWRCPQACCHAEGTQDKTNQKLTDMKLRKAVIGASVALPLAMAAQPVVMNTDAAGYLERGKLMYESRNYAGAIDQLTHMETLPASASMVEEADYYLALSRFERGEASSLEALQSFIDRYPSSRYVQEAQLKVGNYYFYRGEWESALLSYSLVRDGSLDGDNAEDMLYRQAYSNLRLGNYDVAGQQYERLSHTRQYAAATQFYQAYLDYANGDYATAKNKFAAIDPESELGYQSQYYITQINYKNGQYNQVIHDALQLLAEHENDYFDAELNRVLGESYYHTGQLGQARTYLRRYLDNPEGEPYRTAGYTMGVLDYDDANYAAALQDFALVTGEDDALAQSALLYTGQAKLKQNDLNGAAMAFERAAKMDYDRNVKETAFYNYAISQSKGARTPFNQSISLFEEFLNQYPTSRYRDNVEGYLVDAYMSTNDYQQALTSINHIQNPGARVLKAKQNVLYNLGVQQLANDNNDQAVNYLKQAIAVGNYDATALNESRLWLSEALYRQGDYKGAAQQQQAYLKNASTKGDNYALAQYNLGYTLYQQRNYRDAGTAFQRALNAGKLPADLKADALNRLADTKYYSKDYSGAQATYQQALNAGGGSGADYSMYQKGLMMGLNNQYAEEVAQMDALLKAYPKSAYAIHAMLEKGHAQEALGRGTDAVATYSQVWKSYPKTVEARTALLQTAIVHKNMNNESAAVDAYKQVIKSYPTSNEAQAAVEDMKMIYADRGQLAELNKWLATVPNAPRLNVSEADRLTFESAEKAAIADNPSITRMQQYIADYPQGAYVNKAKYYLGRHYYGSGDYGQALTCLNEALQTGTGAAYAEDALAMRSDILLKQGNGRQALQSYKELAQHATSTDNRLTALLGTMRVAKQIEDWNELKQQADTLLALSGLTAEEEKEVTLNRAVALSHLGKTDDAASDLATLAKDPNSEAGAQAAYELANLQFSQANYKGAERTINALIDAGTPHSYWLAKGFILLSDIYYKRGQVTQAREYLQSLRSNYPGSEQDIITEIDTRLRNWKSGTSSAKGNSSTDNTKKKK